MAQRLDAAAVTSALEAAELADDDAQVARATVREVVQRFELADGRDAGAGAGLAR